MDFFKKLLEQLKQLWGKWSLVQKLILCGVAAAVLAGTIALVSVSSSPRLFPVINRVIGDEEMRNRIIDRISEENVQVQVSGGIIMVTDKLAAKRMRTILIREGLIPQGTDPWAIFDRERWTITDMERNVTFQRAQTRMIQDHIRAVDGIDDAKVIIVFPKEQLFSSDQKPVSASVRLVPRPGSDIAENPKKIEGIQKLLKYAVEGLVDENIVITDQNGIQLNDFEGMKDFDTQSLIEREQKNILKLEAEYRTKILTSLQSTFTQDRVRDLNIKIDMDMSKKSINKTEYKPFVQKPRTPGSVFDDSVIKDSVTVSKETYDTTFEGTGFNPEGPAGTEPNVMPAYADMSNVQGKVTQHVEKLNEYVSSEISEIEQKPKIDRLTVSVNIDGTWKLKYDEKGKLVIRSDNSLEREYTPVDPAVLRETQSLVQDAVGFDANRGDSVTVRNIQFDRTRQFGDEDAAYFRQQSVQRTIIIFLVGLVLLLAGFIIFRIVSKAIERRRLAAEEALARERQAARERAMLEAEQEGVEVSMSVEERKRMELQENVLSLAKEHPQDAAQLIRTWLLEE